MSHPPRRPLGTTGVEISPIGLGCMGMSDFYGEADDARSTALLHHALDAGVNFFDTADMYGPWTNERLVGAALRQRRDEAVIATKFGVVRDEKGDKMSITYVAGQGVTVNVKGKDKGTIEGADFAKVMFTIFFGPKPPNSDLKEGMLGQKK